MTGPLMVDHMQQAWDVVVEPGRTAGAITDDDMATWTDRATSTFSTRNREFLTGVAAGSDWPIEKVGMLDQVMEFGIYQSKLHSFAGCTSITSWGGHSADGGADVGRNMDWTPEFTEFAQVLTVRSPSDGSYRYATTGWPGMYGAFTALNEHGVYLDLRDGASMGGSVVYTERPPTLNTDADLMSETASLSALARRLNGVAQSVSSILTLVDESGAVSMECSPMAGNRLRRPDRDSLVVVNSFLTPTGGWASDHQVGLVTRPAGELERHRGCGGTCPMAALPCTTSARTSVAHRRCAPSRSCSVVSSRADHRRPSVQLSVSRNGQQ